MQEIFKFKSNKFMKNITKNIYRRQKTTLYFFNRNTLYNVHESQFIDIDFLKHYKFIKDFYETYSNFFIQ